MANDIKRIKLIPLPVIGSSFKITPTGIIPEKIVTYELKTIDGSYTLSFQNGRFDVLLNRMSNDASMPTLEEFKEIAIEMNNVLLSNFEIGINRCALAVTLFYGIDIQKDKMFGKFIKDEQIVINSLPCEWEIRRVSRENLSANININYGSKIFRNLTQLPFEVIPVDRIGLELDINTLPANFLFDKECIIKFYDNAASRGVELINWYNDKIETD